MFSSPVTRSDKSSGPLTTPEVILKVKTQVGLLPSGSLGSELTPSSSRQPALGSYRLEGVGVGTRLCPPAWVAPSVELPHPSWARLPRSHFGRAGRGMVRSQTWRTHARSVTAVSMQGRGRLLGPPGGHLLSPIPTLGGWTNPTLEPLTQTRPINSRRSPIAQGFPSTPRPYFSAQYSFPTKPQDSQAPWRIVGHSVTLTSCSSRPLCLGPFTN